MTWPGWIAAGLLSAFAYLIVRHQRTQHRSSTTQHTDPQDGEPRT